MFLLLGFVVLFLFAFFIVIYKKIVPIDIDKKRGSKAIRIIQLGNSFERKSFLTKRERDFFIELRKILKKEYYVMCQVRVVDIITPHKRFSKNSKEFIALFRQVSQWHCDFLIINNNFDVEVAIELDDSTHNQLKRKRRDEILNEVFRQSGVNLIRVHDYNQFIKLPECNSLLDNKNSL